MEPISPQITEILRILGNWCYQTTPNAREGITRYLMVATDHHNQFTVDFLKEVHIYAPHIMDTQESCINAFAYYILGGLFALCHYKALATLHGEHNVIKVILDRCLRISLICLLVDVALDDEANRVHNRTILSALGAQLANKRNLLEVDVSSYTPVIQSIVQLLNIVIADTPAIIGMILVAFKGEMESTRQIDEDLSFAELSKIEGTKAYVTMKLFADYLFNGTDTHIPMELGTVIQFFDDLADHHIDVADGTKTVVTSEIRRCGTSDLVYYQALKALDSLPLMYWPLKIMFGYCFSCIGSTSPYTSEQLTAALQPYSLVINRGKDYDTPMYRSGLHRHILYNLQYVK